jgi:DNA-binding response OmpR family regulator
MVATIVRLAEAERARRRRTNLGQALDGDLPLVVCVTPDTRLRLRLAKELDGTGVVLMCPDLETLRSLLAPPGGHSVAIPSSTVVQPGVVAVGELRMDGPAAQVTWRGRPVELTRIERELLDSLASPLGRVWSYERLYRRVWRSSYLGDASVLHSAVKRLRRKLRESEVAFGIETVRGVGYRLRAKGLPVQPVG